MANFYDATGHGYEYHTLSAECAEILLNRLLQDNQPVEEIASALAAVLAAVCVLHGIPEEDAVAGLRKAYADQLKHPPIPLEEPGGTT